jgi:hypothetical protein
MSGKSGKKGFSKEDELLLQDFSKNVSTKVSSAKKERREQLVRFRGTRLSEISLVKHLSTKEYYAK